jgi:hypothetical protein
MSGKRVLRHDNYNLEGALGDNTPPPVRLSAAPQKVNAGKKIAESAAAALRAAVAASETAASAAAKSAAEAKESAEMAHQEAERVVTRKNKACKNEKYVFLDEKDNNFRKLENVSRSIELVKFFVSTYDTPNIFILPSASGYEGSLLTLALQNNFKGVNINSEIVKYLINEGVDTSYKEQIRKNTALHYAAIAEIPEETPPSNPNLDCVKLLLTCPQTNLFAQNAEGFTPRKLLTIMLDRGTRINRNQKEHVEVENFLLSLEKQRGGKGTRHIRKNKNKNKNKKSRKYTRRN